MPPTARWLAGAIATGRARQRRAGAQAKPLGCARIYLFPNPRTQSLLLAGADCLDAAGRALFKLIALTPRAGLSFSPAELALEIAEAAYDLPRALQRILTELALRQPCAAAYLAIRQGEAFRVEAVHNGKADLLGYTFPLAPHTPGGELVEIGQGKIVTARPEIAALAPPFAFKQPLKAWMGVPLRIGRRVIGLVAFLGEQPKAFTPADVRLAQKLAQAAAPLVENAMAFAEAERHLQRLALLNEMASAASISLDLENVARRVLRLLRRTFPHSRVGLFLLAADGRALQSYGEDRRLSRKHSLLLEPGLGEQVLESGAPLRRTNAAQTTSLLVPLTYRGRPVGVLGLETDAPHTFSVQDEQLLLVIASHLAGLIVNVHLNEETRRRAHNLAAIHRIVQQIVGLLDVEEIAQAAAALTAGQFEYDLVLVLLADDPDGGLIAYGAGGKLAGRVPARWQTPARAGEGFPQPFSPFAPGELPSGEWAQTSLPLQAGEQTLGILYVARNQAGGFSENDRLVLESLAGVLSTVFMNARRYQQLQERIQAQKLAEKRLVNSARLAAVGEIAAGVAHELNNPLTTIAGFSELILEDLPEDAAHREDLRLVWQEAHRARDVVRRLLDFSRPDESFKELADFTEILGEALALVHHLARVNGIEIRFVPWADLPKIRMDRRQIKQVVLNLVQNALQAMPRGGTIVVQTTPEQREGRDWVALRVIDNGQGIPMEIVSRVFEPFFTTKPPGQGTGLGLSISNHIVSEHGGFMEVDSQPGQGTCFAVWLPVHGSEGEAP